MLKFFEHILTIAQHERMMLYRTARFWILAGAGIAVVLFFIVAPTLAVIIDSTPPAEFLLKGADVYLALLFFGFMQVILIIFVAAHFHKAEASARLDQVMLSRPVTTLALVLGKYFGVVSAVLLVNILLIAMAMTGRLFKAYFAGAGLSLTPALVYFFIVTIPAVLFMTALVFFLISLLRSQVVAILLPLGYSAAIFFWLQFDYLGLFDFSASFAPLFASDIIGFGDIRAVLLQRLFFLFLAGFMLFAAVVRYPRLHQSRMLQRLSAVLAGVFLLAALIPAGTLISDHVQHSAWREKALAANRQALDKPQVAVSHYEFDLRFARAGSPLQASVAMRVENRTAVPFSELIFSLNPALQVTAVQSAARGELAFEHEFNLLTIDYGTLLHPGARDTLTVQYNGTIDADAFLLDRLPELDGKIRKKNGPWIKGDLSAWLSRDAGVLPYESGWYPIPGPASGFDHTRRRPHTFATAGMTVRGPAEVQFISQGDIAHTGTSGGEQVIRFESAKPVPGFSINYGPYRRLAWQFDAAEVELYLLQEHMPELELFAEVADTCRQVIDELLVTLEATTGIAYPWQRLSFVEVPLQMQVWPTASGINNVLLQPGVIMIDELRILKRRLDKQFEKRRKIERRRGRDDSAARIKRDVFIRAVLELLFPKDFWVDGTLNSPLKNYLHFQLDIRDPLLYRALEMQFYEQSQLRLWDTFFPDRRGQGISGNDRMRQLDSEWAFRNLYGVSIDSVISLLTRVPLRAISPREHGKLYFATVDFKAPPVLKMLRERVGEKAWRKMAAELTTQHRGKNVNAQTLLDLLQPMTDEDLSGFFDDWFGSTVFPGYQLTHASAVKVKTGSLKTAYQVRVRVRNGEKGDGFVRLRLRTRNDTIWRNLALGSYEEKEVLISLYDKPRDVTVVPYFSRNRGQLRRTIDIASTISRAALQDTAYTIIPSAADSLVFVLDDQDEGFFTATAEEARYLRPPVRGKVWALRTHAMAFGKYFYGWHVKRGQSGDYPARWETRVPKTGYYQLSYYLPVGRSWYTRNPGPITLYIETARGREKTVLHPQVTADNWQPVGKFYFEKDRTAVVEISDAGQGYVVVDALRWEYVE